MESRKRLALGVVVVFGAAVAGCGVATDEAGPRARSEQPVATGQLRGPGCQIAENAAIAYLVVKTHDGIRLVRDADGGLELLGEFSPEARTQFESRLGQLNEALVEHGLDPAVAATPLFGTEASPSDAEHGEDEQGAGEQAAGGIDGSATVDLGTYLAIGAGKLERSEALGLCEALAANPLVELAYPQPIAEPAGGVDLAEDPLFSRFYRDYHAPSDQGGFGSVWGARGEGIRIADVEVGVIADHEDLPEVTFVLPFSGEASRDDHGTAVLGIIGAQDNGFGALGLAPNASLGFSSILAFDLEQGLEPSVARAVQAAAQWVGTNGIVVIELHVPAPIPVSRCDPSCNPGQCNYVAMEYFPAIFDVIQAATSAGVHVIQAAGNGEVDLDQALPDRRLRDSGAVLVGASLAPRLPDYPTAGQPMIPQRQPACFSNFGEAVDLFGWGEHIVTTGYGTDPYTHHPVHDLPYFQQPLPEQGYTDSFGGTSGATPLVVGVAAQVLGMAAARGETLLPHDLRSLLMKTGVRQSSGAPPDRPAEFRLIGVQPDAQAAWNAFELYVPTADFEFAVVVEGPAKTVTFTNLSTARSDLTEAAIVATEWDFGDGVSARNDDVMVHTFPAGGTYDVTLRIFTYNGYVRTIRRSIDVVDPAAQSLDVRALEVANTATFRVLDEEVGLDRRAAESIVAFRPFRTIGELTSVPFVKGGALRRLYQYVEDQVPEEALREHAIPEHQIPDDEPAMDASVPEAGPPADPFFPDAGAGGV